MAMSVCTSAALVFVTTNLKRYKNWIDLHIARWFTLACSGSNKNNEWFRCQLCLEINI